MFPMSPMRRLLYDSFDGIVQHSHSFHSFPLIPLPTRTFPIPLPRYFHYLFYLFLNQNYYIFFYLFNLLLYSTGTISFIFFSYEFPCYRYCLKLSVCQISYSLFFFFPPSFVSLSLAVLGIEAAWVCKTILITNRY